ncbi:MAG: TadE family protein [Anaerolineae bacterium]
MNMQDSHKRQDGATLVEFALTIPFLVLLIAGAFDFGWGVYVNNSLALAAREGARKGIIVSATDAQICAQAQRGLQALPTFACNPSSGPGIYISPATRTSTNPITVTVTYTYTPITPIISPFVPNGIPLSSSSVMVVE